MKYIALTLVILAFATSASGTFTEDYNPGIRAGISVKFFDVIKDDLIPLLVELVQEIEVPPFHIPAGKLLDLTVENITLSNVTYDPKRTTMDMNN